jgi:hypothetical protein
MCYSAMVEQRFKEYQRWSASMDWSALEEVFRARAAGESITMGKALESNFYSPQSATESRIKGYIDQYHETLATDWEQGLFAQRKRLADAERTLTQKETKKALEDKRNSTNKIEWYRKKLADLKLTGLKENDSRIFPFWYAPVVIMEKGKYVVRPMRYHCRPSGKPASYDKRFDGLYNARRDSLEGFWKGLFGKRHSFVIVTSFFENAARHNFEKRELRLGEKPQNLVLHFNPRSTSPIMLA